MRRVAAANFSFSDRCYCGYINPIGSFYYCLTANGGANAKISSNKYLGKINYILASKIVRVFAIFLLITTLLLLSRSNFETRITNFAAKIHHVIFVCIYNNLSGLLFLFSIKLSDKIVRVFAIFLLITALLLLSR